MSTVASMQLHFLFAFRRVFLDFSSHFRLPSKTVIWRNSCLPYNKKMPQARTPSKTCGVLSQPKTRNCLHQYCENWVDPNFRSSSIKLNEMCKGDGKLPNQLMNLWVMEGEECAPRT